MKERCEGGWSLVCLTRHTTSFSAIVTGTKGQLCPNSDRPVTLAPNLIVDKANAHVIFYYSFYAALNITIISELLRQGLSIRKVRTLV